MGLSLAYFSSRDEVTNTLGSQTVEIKLLEPNWYKSGMEDAQKMEPGMTILKDPQVYNSSEADVYVRMRIEITFTEEDEDGTETQVTVSRISDNYEKYANRYEAIIAALLVFIAEDGSTGDTADTSDAADTTDATDTTDASDTTDISLFTVTTDSNGDSSYTSNNSSFYYDNDGDWFYYIKDETTDKTTGKPYSLTALAPGNTTDALFEGLKVPIFKTEYYGYFDTAFTINITAQAIATTELETIEEETDGVAMTDFEKAVAAFENYYE